MRKKLIVSGISLLMMIGSISSTISGQDFRVTPTQLKQTNIIFNEHKYLLAKDSLNERLNIQYDSLLNAYNKHDSIVVEKLQNYKAENEKLAKRYKKSKQIAIGGGIISICLLALLIFL
jgi:hypothetical protein